MDLEQARFNMVEQQIRPWYVLDQSVLDLLFTVKRENFVAEHLRSVAFSDLELPISVNGKNTGETMLSPKMEARILQELKIHPHNHVLEIGAGSGYMAALLASKAEMVTSVEIRPEIAEFAKKNLARAGIANVTIKTADAAQGYNGCSAVDVIVVSGALPVLPHTLKSQLKIDGRLLAIVGQAPIQSVVLVHRISQTQFTEKKLFETFTAYLVNAPEPEKFHF
jgi:protein-L-isoaspartate(D-aspartate) O-methyltransferase